MVTSAMSLQITGLARREMAQLAAKAKTLRTTPEGYLKRLLAQDLALDRAARTTTLAQLMGPGRAVDEAELDALVERSRNRHHGQFPRRSKKR